MAREEDHLRKPASYSEPDLEMPEESADIEEPAEDEEYDEFLGYHSFYGF